MLYPNSEYTNPKHKIQVILIGCGGTGTHMLQELSALSLNLVEMEHLGFEIHVFDDDIVEQHNIGRQKFYQNDLGAFKSTVLASRINRSYGDSITSYNRRFMESDMKMVDKYHRATIIITCVDNVKTRKNFHSWINEFKPKNLFWFDTGNDKDSGQVILSIRENNKKITPSCVDLFPDMVEDIEQPSCSTRDALKKQSFTINKFIVNFTIQILSNIFIDYQIPHTQLYFNANPFRIKTK